MKIDDLIKRIKPGREVSGAAAALLPFEPDGRIAVHAFQEGLKATHSAGLMNAVNMDTGYVNYLSDDEKADVLRWTSEALYKKVRFVVGASIEGKDGELL